ncbi:hypothetical protein ScPMuIL_006484 [Solemya velum]
MTDVMDDTDYRSKSFNRNDAEFRHPLWMTESHFIFHLWRDGEGHLNCHKDTQGYPVCSPRHLSQLCIHTLITNPLRLYKTRAQDIPHDLYPVMLTEAIHRRELESINYLVSSWPHEVLDVQSLLPLEEYIDPHYLTAPIEGHENMSLMDCFLFGLLTLRTVSRLKCINFSGFKHDRKLGKELARLAILWISPSKRNVDYIHGVLSQSLDISRDKVQRYLNRISCIYANMDPFVNHGNTVGPVTVVFECKLTLDDVAIGLGLQHETPFRFHCRRLWYEPISEVVLQTRYIHKLLEPRNVTHLDFEDPSICSDVMRFDSLLECLLLLPSLTTVSLPNTIHVNVHSNAAYELNQTLRGLKDLRKLNLSSSNLRDGLDNLLNGLTQPIEYLGLRDCRLNKTDIQFLLQWDNIASVKELNLSRNNLKPLAYLCVSLLTKLRKIICFSISYCCFTTIGLRQIVRRCIECDHLKYLAIQSFTPPPLPDVQELLQDCTTIFSLQKCLLLPETYAFPGSNDSDRIHNREMLLDIAYQYLEHMGRTDIDLE